jgi:xylulose-5-phosphate/fructose-6-phosphate phosphoketolase
MIYVIGPGHGGPGLIAQTYLEGSYTERYPAIERSRKGLRRLFRQFSWPYGIPSHVSPETPGSIHEGGELGYSLLHAYGAAFDNPTVLARIGRGELTDLLNGYGYDPHFVEGCDPMPLHQNLAGTLDAALEHIRRIQEAARRSPSAKAPALADDRLADAKGLDRAEIRRRQTGRGGLARAASSDCRFQKSRAHPLA